MNGLNNILNFSNILSTSVPYIIAANSSMADDGEQCLPYANSTTTQGKYC